MRPLRLLDGTTRDGGDGKGAPGNPVAIGPDGAITVGGKGVPGNPVGIRAGRTISADGTGEAEARRF